MTKKALIQIHEYTNSVRGAVLTGCDLETQHQINWWLYLIEGICNEESQKRDKH